MNNKIKIGIKCVYGNILFSYEKEDNTIKDTLEKAIREGADLQGANLEGADLRDTNLGYANLRGANLINANLERADLGHSNLIDADLEGVNLMGANLEGADLQGANLEGANLGYAYIPIYCKWGVSFVNNDIKIGCKTKSMEEWDKWFESDEEYLTKRNSEDFKRIRAMYEAYKSYANVMK